MLKQVQHDMMNAVSTISQSHLYTVIRLNIKQNVYHFVKSFDKMTIMLYITDMDIHNLLELNELAKEKVLSYPKKREIYNKIHPEKGKHFIGIVGPRGVGKTILLQQIAAEYKDSFYISLDTIEPETDIFEIAKILHNRFKIKILLLDEIHFVRYYVQQLKKIYDFLDIKVIFTSSVSLSLYKSVIDLSRKVELIPLYPFSFREYIYFVKDILLPSLTLKDIVNKKWQKEQIMYEYLFEDYLKGGIYPFSLEETNITKPLENVLNKVIENDIPSVISLKVEELSDIKKVVQFIGKAEVEGINYSSLSRNIGITKYKAQQYTEILEKAFIINSVFPKGTNILKEPKILLNLPYRLIFKNYEQACGAIRKDFFVETLKMTGYIFYYLKSMRGQKTPDYLIDNNEEIIVEIGGKGKGRTQFKGIKQLQKIIFTEPFSDTGNKRPLFLLGFLKQCI